MRITTSTIVLLSLLSGCMSSGPLKVVDGDVIEIVEYEVVNESELNIIAKISYSFSLEGADFSKVLRNGVEKLAESFCNGEYNLQSNDETYMTFTNNPASEYSKFPYRTETTASIKCQ